MSRKRPVRLRLRALSTYRKDDPRISLRKVMIEKKITPESLAEKLNARPKTVYDFFRKNEGHLLISSLAIVSRAMGHRFSIELVETLHAN